MCPAGAEPGGAARGRVGRRSRGSLNAAVTRLGEVRLPPADPGARDRDELGAGALAASAMRAARVGGAAVALPAGRWRPDPAVGRVAGATPR